MRNLTEFGQLCKTPPLLSAALCTQPCSPRLYPQCKAGTRIVSRLQQPWSCVCLRGAALSSHKPGPLLLCIFRASSDQRRAKREQSVPELAAALPHTVCPNPSPQGLQILILAPRRGILCPNGGRASSGGSSLIAPAEAAGGRGCLQAGIT